MFPQSDAAEAPKDQVMIQVVPGVSDRHVPDNMTVRIQDVVRPGPHLPHHSDHDPHPLVLVPGGGDLWNSNNMSSIPAAYRSAEISSSRSAPSGTVRFALKLSATSSLDQQGRLMLNDPE